MCFPPRGAGRGCSFFNLDGASRGTIGACSVDGDAVGIDRGRTGEEMLLRILDRLEEIIITSLMAAATILFFVSVVHRFGTGVPFLYPYLIAIHISWAQELCIYMFIWMAKFGAAYGVRTGIHVGVDVLINQLNPRWQKRVILFGLCGGALFTF